MSKLLFHGVLAWIRFRVLAYLCVCASVLLSDEQILYVLVSESLGYLCVWVPVCLLFACLCVCVSVCLCVCVSVSVGFR